MQISFLGLLKIPSITSLYHHSFMPDLVVYSGTFSCGGGIPIYWSIKLR